MPACLSTKILANANSWESDGELLVVRVVCGHEFATGASPSSGFRVQDPQEENVRRLKWEKSPPKEAITIYNQKGRKEAFVSQPNPDDLMQLFLCSSALEVREVSNVLANKVNLPAVLTHLGPAALPCADL